MKYRSLWAGLAALGAAALLLTLTLKKGAEGLLMWAFPMAQMGSLLRQLSMSGAVGNFVAWILYFAVGLLPLLWLGWRGYRKCTQPEDCLLVLLSGVLFGVLYAMINPGTLVGLLGNTAGVGGKALVSMSVWSVLCCYLVLRLRRAALEEEGDLLRRWLPRLVKVLMAVFVLDIMALELPVCLQTLSSYNLFPLVTCIAACLPNALGLYTAQGALELLDSMEEGRYSDAAVAAAQKLTQRCAQALAVTAITELCYNLLQILCASALTAVDVTVNLPLGSLLFFLAVMLLARMIGHSRELQQDNDLFI